tara:strand:- start:368 stop:496 length:129 start_codon:yes stop_codon:yes gene_type:complete
MGEFHRILSLRLFKLDIIATTTSSTSEMPGRELLKPVIGFSV